MKKKVLIFFALIAIAETGFCQPENIAAIDVEVNWPKEYKLKTVVNQQDSVMHTIKLVPENETINNWKILAVINSNKKKKVQIDNVPLEIFKDVKKNEPHAKLTVLNKSVKNSWVIFKIEAPRSANKPDPISQLVYVDQWETIRNSVSVIVKRKALTDSFVKKWINVFNRVEIDYAVGSY